MSGFKKPAFRTLSFTMDGFLQQQRRSGSTGSVHDRTLVLLMTQTASRSVFLRGCLARGTEQQLDI